jgi:hypothetical protein
MLPAKVNGAEGPIGPRPHEARPSQNATGSLMNGEMPVRSPGMRRSGKQPTPRNATGAALTLRSKMVQAAGRAPAAGIEPLGLEAAPRERAREPLSRGALFAPIRWGRSTNQPSFASPPTVDAAAMGTACLGDYVWKLPKGGFISVDDGRKISAGGGTLECESSHLTPHKLNDRKSTTLRRSCPSGFRLRESRDEFFCRRLPKQNPGTGMPGSAPDG